MGLMDVEKKAMERQRQMCLQAKEYQGLLEAPRSWERSVEQIVPQILQQELILTTPYFRYLASRIVREIFSVILNHPVCGNLF